MPIDTGSPSPVTLLFSRPIRAYEKARQDKNIKGSNAWKIVSFFCSVYSSCATRGWLTMDTWIDFGMLHQKSQWMAIHSGG